MTSFDETWNPSGLCQCGCGERTKRAYVSDPRRGIRIGDHFKYVRNHVARVRRGKPGFPPGTLVSPEDEHFRGEYYWRDNIRGGYVYTYLPKSNGKRKKILLHHAIMQPAKGYVVDHINGNVLDNRRENLRVVTNSVNMLNVVRPNSNTSSGYRNVHWSSYCKKWRAEIMIGGKKIHLGLFDDPAEAHEAVVAFRESHGIVTKNVRKEPMKRSGRK